MKLSEIKPYWRNPRVNDKTIEELKKSITDYGFNVPIMVDSNRVIITGHARYKAVTQLGMTEVWAETLDLDESKARKYRLADNKIAELSLWDKDYLRSEIMEAKEVPGFTQADIDLILKDDMLKFENMTPEELQKVQDDVLSRNVLSKKEFYSKMVEILCPHCKQGFTVNPKDLAK